MDTGLILFILFLAGLLLVGIVLSFLTQCRQNEPRRWYWKSLIEYALEQEKKENRK